MKALMKLVERCNEMDITEQINWLGDAFMAYQAKQELDTLEAHQTAQAVDEVYWLCKNGHKNHDMGTRFCWACDAPRN